MRFVLLFLLTSCVTSVTSCVTSVTYEHWTQCEKGCGLRGVKEACVTMNRGPACTCFDGFTFWVEGEEEIDIMGY